MAMEKGRPRSVWSFGIEEDFGVPAAIGMQPREIGERHLPEIVLGHQDVRALITDVEKVLQVGEGVCRPHLLHALEWEIDLVALAEGKHLLGLERAFDMQVELGLGNAADECGEICHVHDSKRIVRGGVKSAQEFDDGRTGIACWASGPSRIQ